MAVYKRGYQRYDGPLRGGWTRFMVLPRYAWQRLYQQRLVVLLTMKRRPVDGFTSRASALRGPSG